MNEQDGVAQSKKNCPFSPAAALRHNAPLLIKQNFVLYQMHIYF